MAISEVANRIQLLKTEVNLTTTVSTAATRARVAGRGFSFAAPLPLHLAFKEIWRNKGRFFLIAIVVALITLLVLFTAGLAEGLGLGNREFIEKVDADLVVYSDKSDLLIPGSRISEGRIRDLRQIDGVQAVGAIAWANVAIVSKEEAKSRRKWRWVACWWASPANPP